MHARTFLSKTSDRLPFTCVLANISPRFVLLVLILARSGSTRASCAAARVGSSTSSMPKVLRRVIYISYMTALSVPRCEPIIFLEISSRRSSMPLHKLKLHQVNRVLIHVLSGVLSGVFSACAFENWRWDRDGPGLGIL
jgi:hypothetical protein